MTTTIRNLSNPSYERLRGVIGTPECTRWREAIFDKHWPIMAILVNHYEALATTQDYVVANHWLRDAHQQLRLGSDTLLWHHSDIQEVSDYCEAKTRSWARQIGQAKQAGQSLTEVINTLRPRVEFVGVDFPALPDEPTEAHYNGALARVTDVAWLRRQLRAKQARAMEAFLRGLGVVSKFKGIYVSDFSFQRRTEQKQRGQQLLATLEAENELGQTYTLKELSDLSVSNPINRRHELMTRIRGFDEFAEQDKDDWQGVLFTVTCPSKYHVIRSKSGDKIKHFNHTTPTQASEYVNRLWQRTRALWDQAGIRVFGFRVAEPNHDGTPHWHLLLYIRPHQVQQAEAIFKAHALAEDGDEHGAQTHRFQTLLIDPNKGTGAGYIAKYIAKNIDGFGIDTDSYGKPAVMSALRIEAWASLWGIRQFQQIGGPSVTVWRELRRLNQEDAQEALVERLRNAAHNGDWCLYTDLMGGATCSRHERPARPMMIIQDSLNKYAEPIKVIKGILLGPTTIITRVHQWVVSAINQPAANDEHHLPPQPVNAVIPMDAIHSVASMNTADSALALASLEASPWTCVNNCNVQDDFNHESTLSDYEEYANQSSSDDSWAMESIPIDAYG